MHLRPLRAIPLCTLVRALCVSHVLRDVFRADSVAPTATITLPAGQSNPTREQRGQFELQWSEPVVGFANSSLRLQASRRGLITAGANVLLRVIDLVFAATTMTLTATNTIGLWNGAMLAADSTEPALSSSDGHQPERHWLLHSNNRGECRSRSRRKSESGGHVIASEWCHSLHKTCLTRYVDSCSETERWRLVRLECVLAIMRVSVIEFHAEEQISTSCPAPATARARAQVLRLIPAASLASASQFRAATQSRALRL